METKYFLMLAFANLLIGYYLYVLYKTLQYQRQYGKSAEAMDLYLKTRPFQSLLFGKFIRSNGKSKYKVLRNEEEEDKTRIE